jgi:hypothetical protein
MLYMIIISKLAVKVTPCRLRFMSNRRHTRTLMFQYFWLLLSFSCHFFFSLKIYYPVMFVLVFVPCTMNVILVPSSHTGNTNVKFYYMFFFQAKRKTLSSYWFLGLFTYKCVSVLPFMSFLQSLEKGLILIYVSVMS